MATLKYQKYIDEINDFICEYGRDSELVCVDIELLISSKDMLEICSNYILDLFCSVGIEDDYEPNAVGKRLNSCLEFLSELRYRYHDVK